MSGRSRGRGERGSRGNNRGRRGHRDASFPGQGNRVGSSNTDDVQARIHQNATLHQSHHAEGLGFSRSENMHTGQSALTSSYYTPFKLQHTDRPLLRPIAFVRGENQPLLKVDLPQDTLSVPKSKFDEQPIDDTVTVKEAEEETFFVDIVPNVLEEIISAPVIRVPDSDSEEDEIVYIPPSASKKPSPLTTPIELSITQDANVSTLIQQPESNVVSEEEPLAAEPSEVLGKQEPAVAIVQNIFRDQSDQLEMTTETQVVKNQDTLPDNLTEAPSSVPLIPTQNETRQPRIKITSSEKRRLKREGRKRRKSATKHGYISRAGSNIDVDNVQDDSDMRTSDDEEVEVFDYRSQKRTSKRKQSEMHALSDYLSNTLIQAEEEELEGETKDISLNSFVQSVAGLTSTSGQAKNMTINDLEDEARSQAERRNMEQDPNEGEGGWTTEEDVSGSDGDQIEGNEENEEDNSEESDVDSDESGQSSLEAVLNIEEIMLIGESSDSDEESHIDEDSSDVDKRETKRQDLADEMLETVVNGGVARLGFSGNAPRHVSQNKKSKFKKSKGKESVSEETDSNEAEVFDDEFFNGNDTWQPGSKYKINEYTRNSKGNFRKRGQDDAIGKGDFTIYDYDDDPLSTYMPRAKGKGKNKKMPDFNSEDEFINELQEQWQKDRQRKSDRKRARLQARMESKPTKANIKKAKRAGVEIKPRNAIDLHAIHISIKDFLSTPDRATLSLPPMGKKDRVAVHLLAECYFLKSQSKGSGERRFPILSRTAHSTLYGVDMNKISSILKAAKGESMTGNGGKGKGRTGALWKELYSSKSSTVRVQKNRDGDVVGHGAEVLGDSNRGFRMLSMMGWSQGASIGLQGGINQPIAAVIKTGRSGLGH